MNADFLKQMMSQKGGKDGANNMDFLQNCKYWPLACKPMLLCYNYNSTNNLLIFSIQL